MAPSDNGRYPLPSHVLHWYSPFPLSEPVLTQLKQAGLQRLQKPPGEDQEPALLLYDTPDRLLEATELEATAVLEGYKALLTFPVAFPRLAFWRCLALGASLEDHVATILTRDLHSDEEADPLPPSPDPLTALVTIALCRSVSGLLDAYLDLELQARLLGGEPDADYLRRLQNTLKPEKLLQSWRTPAGLTLELEDLRRKLSDAESSLSKAREEAELTLLQLHQVQEELEEIFLADRAKQHLLQGKDQTMAELREQLEGRGQEVAELRAQLIEKEGALSDAREDTELALQQLHQVQEELEHYFLLSRGQKALLQRHEELEQRSERLLVNLWASPGLRKSRQGLPHDDQTVHR